MSWRDDLPRVRGRLLRDESLAPFTWFRVGGPADVLFLPADEADLAAFLAALPGAISVNVVGVGSNLIVRDGGVAGVAIRLAGRNFAGVEAKPDASEVRAGAGALDAAVARAAAEAGVSGLEFYAGIPGTVGGALVMNAGCYGSDTSRVLVEARGVNRQGEPVTLTVDALDYAYRSSRTPEGVIWTEAIFRGWRDEPEAIRTRMTEITARREQTQPLREKTGGSTFKNPPGLSAWKLVDEAGWRGKTVGGARMSELHANFMINDGSARAADLETLGEAVRSDVLAKTAVTLDWEIRRIGSAQDPESR